MSGPDEHVSLRPEEKGRDAVKQHQCGSVATKKLELPDAVILDMDGTLVLHHRPGILRGLEILGSVTARFARLWPSHTPSRTGELKRPPRLYGHRLIHRLRRSEVREIVSPAPGTEDFLSLLKSTHIPVALVSNGLGRGYGRDILATYDLARYFDAAVFREDTRRAKPYPDSLLKALHQLDLPKTSRPHVIWYIGDQAKDMVAVRAAQKQDGHAWQAILYCASSKKNCETVGNADLCFVSWSTLTKLAAKLLAHKSVSTDSATTRPLQGRSCH